MSDLQLAREISAARDRVVAQRDTALEVLDSLTDATFLLMHLLDKGYRLDDQKDLVKMVLEDAIVVLRQQGLALDGCTKCGSRHPESSNWHRSRCVPDSA